MTFDYDQFSETILSQINGFYAHEKEMRKEISQLDVELSDFYHALEKSKFNACEGYHKAKQLQDLLFRRRKIKLELAKINSLKATLGLEQIQEKVLHSKNRVIKVERDYTKKFKCN